MDSLILHCSLNTCIVIKINQFNSIAISLFACTSILRRMKSNIHLHFYCVSNNKSTIYVNVQVYVNIWEKYLRIP